MRTLKYNLLITFIFLLLIEITGQLIYFFNQGHSLFNNPEKKYRELIFHRHPYLSVALNKNVRAEFPDKTEKVITTTNLGTRWTGADLNDTSIIRIACLGGSTTFCVMASDQESWCAQLQKKLGNKYAVINYGCPGYSTVENIIQMSLMVPEMKPDLVIFYEGWNDIRNYHQPHSYPDYFWHGSQQVSNVLDTEDNESLTKKIKKHSGLFYIVDNIRERIFKLKQPKLFSSPDPVIDSLFIRNLHTLQILAEAINAKTIFIPQIINPDIKRIKGSSRKWTPAIDDEAFPELMNHFNDLQMQTIHQDSTNYYLDEMQIAIQWNNLDFADDGHFSNKGNERFADVLAKKIFQIPF